MKSVSRQTRLICLLLFVLALGLRFLTWQDNRYEIWRVQSSVSEGSMRVDPVPVLAPESPVSHSYVHTYPKPFWITDEWIRLQGGERKYATMKSFDVMKVPAQRIFKTAWMLPLVAGVTVYRLILLLSRRRDRKLQTAD